MDSKQTKFEEDLQVYFPDIYKIHQAGKYDRYIWDVFSSMMEFINHNQFGEITIKYQSGKINQILKTLVTTSGKETKPNLTSPNYLE